MSERNVFEGIRDELFGVPHSSFVSDTSLGLRYQRDAAESLRRLAEQRGGSAETAQRSLSPEDYAEAMAPHFRDAAFAQFQMNNDLRQDLSGLGSSIVSGLGALSESNQRNFDSVADAIGGMEEKVMGGLQGIRTDVGDASRGVSAAVTGASFDYLKRRQDVSTSVTGNHLREIVLLWSHRKVGYENFQQALKWGEISGVDKLMLEGLFKGQKLPQEPTAQELAAKTLFDYAQKTSLEDMVRSGALSRQALAVLNEAGLFKPDFQANLYKARVVEPPVWSLAATNIGISRVARSTEIGVAQRAAMLREQSVSNQYLGGIHHTMKGVGADVRGMRGDIHGMRGDIHGLKGAVETGFGNLNETALRSEAYLAAAAGSLEDVVCGIDVLGADISMGLASLDGTIQHGFDGVSTLLAESIRVNMAGAEHVAAQVAAEGDRQAVYMESLITAVFRTADDVLKSLDMVRGDLSDLKEIGLRELQAQVRIVHELSSMRQEQNLALGRLVGLAEERNQVLQDISGGIQDVLKEVRVAPSVREFDEAMERATEAMSKADDFYAKHFLEKALQYKPTHPKANFHMARLLLKEKNVEKAKEFLARAIDYAESPLEKAHYVLFVALCDADQNPDRGESLLEFALSLNPDVQIMMIRALMFFQVDKKAQAYLSLRKAVAKDGRVILELVHNERYRDMRDDLLDEVLLPIIEGTGVVDVRTLFYITEMIEEVEGENFPSQKVKTRLKQRWRAVLKSVLKNDPIDLIANPFLSGILSPSSSEFIGEIVQEVLNEGLPMYKGSVDYYYFASLMFAGCAPSDSDLRKVLLKALSLDKRADTPTEFSALMNDIAKMAKGRAFVFFETIMMSGGSEFRAFKNYLHRLIHG